MGISSRGADRAQAEGDQLVDERRRSAGCGRRGRADQRLADRADERRRAELAVLGRKLARGDAILQRRSEDVAEGPAEMQALRLDRRVDRLGQQRPGQPPSGQRAPCKDRDGGGDARRGGAGCGRRGGRDGVDLALRRGAEDLGEELGLRREVAVDAARGDAGSPCDRRDRSLAVAATRDQLARRASVRSVGR
jgi:hypothetical protein